MNGHGSHGNHGINEWKGEKDSLSYMALLIQLYLNGTFHGKHEKKGIETFRENIFCFNMLQTFLF